MSKEIKFEEAISKLEDAVRLLEGGTLSLDESIDKYEEALKYVKICNESEWGNPLTFRCVSLLKGKVEKWQKTPQVRLKNL